MKVLVSSHGCEWAGKNMAQTLGAEFANSPQECDLRLLVGYYFNNGEEVQKRELRTASKTVVWWVGTDILWLEQSRDPARVAWLNQNVTEHWAEWITSKTRLEKLGLKNVKVVPMPTRHRYQIMPLPAEFAVGCYCYDSREGFYGARLVREAARLSPDVLWKLYPRRRPGRQGNVEQLPRVGPDEMDQVYRQMSVHVRMVEADGMPQGPMEAMMAGRPVIYNYRPMPFVRHLPAPTPATLAAAVRKVRDLQILGEGLEIEGSKYWREFNDPATLRAEIARVWEGP